MSTLKQIIITHYNLPPIVGGVEAVLAPQAELFARNNFYVTLLAGGGKIEGTNIKTSIIPELNPTETHIKSFQNILKTGSLPESYELRLKDLSRKIEAYIGNINNVIIHNIMTMPFNLTATEAFWNFITNNPNKRFFIWTHDIAWIMKDYQSYLYERRRWSLMKTAIPNVIYITISELRRRQLSGLLNIPKRKIIVVPNAIKYQDFFKFSEPTLKVISTLQPFQRYPVILFPSRIIPRKNLERGINIIAALRDNFPDLLAIITGIPEQTNNKLVSYAKKLHNIVAANQLEQHVIFLNDLFEELNIPQEKNTVVVRDLYFVSHLVMLLSTDEGFGLPILEAGITRVPIATSQIPIFREIAKDGVLYLPSNESIEKNSDRLFRFLTTSRSKSSILFRRVFSKYNWDRLWIDYLSNIFG